MCVVVSVCGKQQLLGVLGTGSCACDWQLLIMWTGTLARSATLCAVDDV